MDQIALNSQRLCELMDEQIRSRSPAERDRVMQQFLAQAMTPAQRFHALCVLMDFAIAQNRAKRGLDNG